MKLSTLLLLCSLSVLTSHSQNINHDPNQLVSLLIKSITLNNNNLTKDPIKFEDMVIEVPDRVLIQNYTESYPVGQCYCTLLFTCTSSTGTSITDIKDDVKSGIACTKDSQCKFSKCKELADKLTSLSGRCVYSTDSFHGYCAW